MVLNHLDLQVSDVQAFASFLEAHFRLIVQTSRTSPAIAILSDGAGFVLVLQKKQLGGQGYPEGFHLGFLVDDVKTVEDTHRALVEAGAQVSAIDRNKRGTTLYCRAPDGILVEVSCRDRR